MTAISDFKIVNSLQIPFHIGIINPSGCRSALVPSQPKFQTVAPESSLIIGYYDTGDESCFCVDIGLRDIHRFKVITNPGAGYVGWDNKNLTGCYEKWEYHVEDAFLVRFKIASDETSPRTVAIAEFMSPKPDPSKSIDPSEPLS